MNSRNIFKKINFKIARKDARNNKRTTELFLIEISRTKNKKRRNKKY